MAILILFQLLELLQSRFANKEILINSIKLAIRIFILEKKNINEVYELLFDYLATKEYNEKVFYTLLCSLLHVLTATGNEYVEDKHLSTLIGLSKTGSNRIKRISIHILSGLMNLVIKSENIDELVNRLIENISDNLVFSPSISRDVYPPLASEAVFFIRKLFDSPQARPKLNSILKKLILDLNKIYEYLKNNNGKRIQNLNFQSKVRKITAAFTILGGHLEDIYEGARVVVAGSDELQGVIVEFYQFSSTCKILKEDSREVLVFAKSEVKAIQHEFNTQHFTFTKDLLDVYEKLIFDTFPIRNGAISFWMIQLKHSGVRSLNSILKSTKIDFILDSWLNRLEAICSTGLATQEDLEKEFLRYTYHSTLPEKKSNQFPNLHYNYPSYLDLNSVKAKEPFSLIDAHVIKGSDLFIRSNYPIPLQAAMYLFEIHMISIPEEGFGKVVVGLADSNSYEPGVPSGLGVEQISYVYVDGVHRNSTSIIATGNVLGFLYLPFVGDVYLFLDGEHVSTVEDFYGGPYYPAVYISGGEASVEFKFNNFKFMKEYEDKITDLTYYLPDDEEDEEEKPNSTETNEIEQEKVEDKKDLDVVKSDCKVKNEENKEEEDQENEGEGDEDGEDQEGECEEGEEREDEEGEEGEENEDEDGEECEEGDEEIEEENKENEKENQGEKNDQSRVVKEGDKESGNTLVENGEVNEQENENKDKENGEDKEDEEDDEDDEEDSAINLCADTYFLTAGFDRKHLKTNYNNLVDEDFTMFDKFTVQRGSIIIGPKEINDILAYHSIIGTVIDRNPDSIVLNIVDKEHNIDSDISVNLSDLLPCSAIETKLVNYEEFIATSNCLWTHYLRLLFGLVISSSLKIAKEFCYHKESFKKFCQLAASEYIGPFSTRTKSSQATKIPPSLKYVTDMIKQLYQLELDLPIEETSLRQNLFDICVSLIEDCSQIPSEGEIPIPKRTEKVLSLSSFSIPQNNGYVLGDDKIDFEKDEIVFIINSSFLHVINSMTEFENFVLPAYSCIEVLIREKGYKIPLIEDENLSDAEDYFSANEDVDEAANYKEDCEGDTGSWELKEGTYEGDEENEEEEGLEVEGEEEGLEVEGECEGDEEDENEEEGEEADDEKDGENTAVEGEGEENEDEENETKLVIRYWNSLGPMLEFALWIYSLFSEAKDPVLPELQHKLWMPVLDTLISNNGPTGRNFLHLSNLFAEFFDNHLKTDTILDLKKTFELITDINEERSSKEEETTHLSPIGQSILELNCAITKLLSLKGEKISIVDRAYYTSFFGICNLIDALVTHTDDENKDRENRISQGLFCQNLYSREKYAQLVELPICFQENSKTFKYFIHNNFRLAKLMLKYQKDIPPWLQISFNSTQKDLEEDADSHLSPFSPGEELGYYRSLTNSSEIEITVAHANLPSFECSYCGSTKTTECYSVCILFIYFLLFINEYL